MKKLLTLLIITMLAGLGQAQDLNLDVTNSKHVRHEIQVINTDITLPDMQVVHTVMGRGKEVKASTFPAKTVTVLTDLKAQVRFETVNRSNASEHWIQIGENSYSCSEPGKYWIFAETVTGQLQEDGKTVKIIREWGETTVTLGPVVPDPDEEDEDDPDLPDSAFPETTALVAKMTEGLSKNKEFSALFNLTAQKMQENFLFRTIDAKNFITSQYGQFLPEYKAAIEALQEDGRGKSLGRSDVIKYYQAIAIGVK